MPTRPSTPSPWKAARDYNRGLTPPVRWLHAIAAALRTALAPALGWLNTPGQRFWRWPILLGTLGVLILWQYDAAVAEWARNLRLGGDFRRELEALQQFGGLGSLVLVAVLVWTLTPANRRRLADLAAAAAATGLATYIGKILIGRPRPRMHETYDAGVILAPTGVHPFPPPLGPRHAWEFWQPIGSDFWSFPSSHTSAAVALAVFLAVLYPRARWVWITLVAVVALARVLFGAHYPSDVVAGAALGVIVAVPIVTSRVASRRFPGRPPPNRPDNREPRGRHPETPTL